MYSVYFKNPTQQNDYDSWGIYITLIRIGDASRAIFIKMATLVEVYLILTILIRH